MPVGVAAIPTIGLLSGVPPIEPKKPMGATELPATMTVAPGMPAPAESFTEPEIRPPVVAALGRIVRGPEDGPAPTATARRAEPTISDVTALVDWMARQRPTTRKGRGREAGTPRWRRGLFTQGVSAEKSSQTN